MSSNQQQHSKVLASSFTSSPAPASPAVAGTSTTDYFAMNHASSSSSSSSARPTHQKKKSVTFGATIVADEGDAAQDNVEAQKQKKMKEMAEHATRFAVARDGLVGAIDETGTILCSLRDFNKQRLMVHYPTIDRKAAVAPPRMRRAVSSAVPSGRQEPFQRAVSEEPSEASPHPGLHRSNTEVASQSVPSTPTKEGSSKDDSALQHSTDDQSEMSVLRLDLKLGAAGNNNPQALIRTLERSSVAQLLDERMTSSIRQLDNLRDRISDTQSKVLVTGDLNAGKSTFVNALMRRKMMPVDQQPCTTVFCEVLDAEQVNEGVEEVHLIHPGMAYDVNNANTYTRHSLDEVERIVAEAEDLNPEDAPMLKCYCHDTRATQESLLRNGIVDIALIDAPGLNRDSMKTTALFARQDEIDVVVFVVSAENHFTLSAKEFLWNASNDKAYIFIVVNKFDQIRNKEKCKRLVLEQIKQLSPRTYEDAAELVHFVDSNAVFGGNTDCEDYDDVATPSENTKVAGEDLTAANPSLVSFTQLEACLRDFVLQRREKSKLMPAQTYLLRLLSDIEFLSHTNIAFANAGLIKAQEGLEKARPALAACEDAHEQVNHQLEEEEDSVVQTVSRRTGSALDEAVDLIGQGKPASSRISLPTYTGFWDALHYAAACRYVFSQSLVMAIDDAEAAAREAMKEGHSRIKALGQAHLPSNVEKREFSPKSFDLKLRKARRGYLGLGMGITEDIADPKISDLIDGAHLVQYVIRRRGSDDSDDPKKQLKDVEDDDTLYSSVSYGLGALTLIGGIGNVYGAKSTYDAMIHMINFMGNDTVRKWAPPVLGVTTAGVVVYIIYDLPASIPRNVGRSMKRELSSRNGPISSSSESRKALTKQAAEDNATTIVTFNKDLSSSLSTMTFSEDHKERLSRTVRQVMRLGSYDLQERFRVALAEKKGNVEYFEKEERESFERIDYFGEAKEKVEVVRRKVSRVEIA